MNNMNKEIRIGVTEAAHMQFNYQNLLSPLSKRIEQVQKLGFNGYEAMPGWTTSLELLSLTRDSKPRWTEMVVNIHPSWWLDRWQHPQLGKGDTYRSWLKRYEATLVASFPFLSFITTQRLQEITGATTTYHWPKNNTSHMLSQEKIALKWQQQLEKKGTPLLAENHVLIGMNNVQFKNWLSEKPTTRGLAIVSGPDNRDAEYQNSSAIDVSKFAAVTRGIYLKQGWSEQTLEEDLRKILIWQENQTSRLWILVNYKEGVNETTLNQITKIVNKVN